MTATEKNIAVCQHALYLLRQDVGLPSVEEAETDESLEWAKCRIAFDAAADELWNEHDWNAALRLGADDLASAPGRTDLWTEPMRQALAYGVARELAIPLAGRVEDLKNWDALFRERLAKARVVALETERSALTDPMETEVVANLVPRFTEKADALPRSVKSILDRAAVLADAARSAVLTAQAWNFARAEEEIPGCPVPHGLGAYRFASELPPSCARLLAVYARGGRIDQWKLFGRTIVATEPILAASFVRDSRRPEKWPPLVRQCYVLRLSADVARTEMPTLADGLEQKYQAALAEAKVRDARESHTPDEQSGGNHYVDAMRGRGPFAARLPRHSFHGLV